MSLAIKRATVTDSNLIAPAFDAYRVFYQQTSDIELARKYLSERLKNQESVIFFAYDRSNERPKASHDCLGFVQLYPSFSSVSAKPMWILNDLFITQTARRRGIAKQLMAAAKQHAKETNAKGLILETDTDNTNAQSLYESLGYQKSSDVFHYQLWL
jgi:ribosomal protein S18 acetylase RimI-like enzyme